MMTKIIDSQLAFNRQKGISMVEVTIAMALSLIILAGVMHIFLNNKKTYKVQEAFARLQENGRFAVHFLTEDIRMAGFTGCGGMVGEVTSIADVVPPNGPGDPANVDKVAEFSGGGIEGYEFGSLPIALTDSVNLNTSNVIPNSDVIRIKRGDMINTWLVKNMGSDNANIQLDGATATGMFQANDYLMISDCTNADIFAANNVSNGSDVTIAHSVGANIENKLSKAYGMDADIMRFMSTTYYLGFNAGGQPALFRQVLGNGGSMTPEELVEGVEDMQISYGEDTDGDGTPNVYLSANAITSMDNVVSVRIALQVRTAADNIAAKISGFGDKRLRRTFTTSIAIRNRVT